MSSEYQAHRDAIDQRTGKVRSLIDHTDESDRVPMIVAIAELTGKKDAATLRYLAEQPMTYLSARLEAERRMRGPVSNPSALDGERAALAAMKDDASRASRRGHVGGPAPAPAPKPTTPRNARAKAKAEEESALHDMHSDMLRGGKRGR